MLVLALFLRRCHRACHVVVISTAATASAAANAAASAFVFSAVALTSTLFPARCGADALLGLLLLLLLLVLLLLLLLPLLPLHLLPVRLLPLPHSPPSFEHAMIMYVFTPSCARARRTPARILERGGARFLHGPPRAKRQ